MNHCGERVAFTVTLTALLTLADDALYRGKVTGPNQIASDFGDST